MGRYIVVLWALIFSFSGVSYGQELPKPSGINEYGEYVNQIFNNFPQESTRLTGENFQTVWGQLGPDVKEKIVKQTLTLSDKGFTVKPYFETYIRIINNAVLTANLSEGDLTALLNMTTKVLDTYSNEEIRNYLRSVFLYMDRSILVETPSHQYSLQNGVVLFDFAEQYENLQASTEDQFYSEEDTTYNDDTWEDDDWDDDEWDDDEWDDDDWNDDSWEDDEEWTWDEDEEDFPEDDGYDGQAASPFELIDQNYSADPPPILNGPYFNILEGDLHLKSAKGEVLIKGIKGTFSLLDKTIYTEQGSFTWPEAYGIDNAEVTFSGISIDGKQPIITAQAAEMKLENLMENSIKGEFTYDGSRNSSRRDNLKFISYRNDLKPKIFGSSDIIYTGGLSLVGGNIESTSKTKSLSEVIINRNGERSIRANSFRFYFQDSTVLSNNASVTIFHKLDSIYHPSVRYRYDVRENDLVLNRQKDKYKDTPYTSSYFGMDFTSDLIRWDMDTSAIEISILNAKSEIPVIFQSQDYYNNEVYQGFSNLYNFNPIAVAVDFARKERMNSFYPSDISEYYDLDFKQVKEAMMDLVEQGYADYDFVSGKITLRSKARVFYLAKHKRRDFDNLLILSNVPEGANVVFDIQEEEMDIKGVEKFYISEILDVYIEPDSSIIKLQDNRNFNFNGKLFAGNFEYDGKDFQFRYDSFLVELNQIESIQFYVQDEETGEKRKVDNAISGISVSDSVSVGGVSEYTGTSGILYINKPKNKSGRQMFPEYPKFNGGGSGSIVYFDNEDYLDGAYGKSLYFVLPPFDLDSLSDSDPAAINFAGTFASRGILPEFSEELHIMDDYSLGFEHSIPPDGYQLFEGDARLFNRVTLDKKGLVGHGTLDYLTSELRADDFIFYPDSVSAIGQSFVMKEGDFKSVGYPPMMVDNFHMNWKPGVDSMYISNNADPIDIYNGVVSLDGTATLTHNGVNGKGSLLAPNSQARSEEFTFQKDRFQARHSEFAVNSQDPEKPALAGSDVRINFDVTNRIAEINPEVEGTPAVEFPYAQFKTSIPTAVWDLNAGKVTMVKPEEIDLKYSYFYTTREDLDSLRFSAERAEYDINTQELRVSGIPYIIVADSKITPENGEVLILAESRIGTLRNTTLEIDTLNGFHQLYDGTVDIVSRNEYSAEATYRFINSVQDTFAIKLTDFHLEEVEDGKKGELQTVAEGVVMEEQRLIISEGMFYKGNVKMKARKPALELDGFIKLDLNIGNYDTWIAYSSDAEQQEVIFNFDQAETESGEELTAGIHFDYNDYSLYPTFIFDKRNPTDEDFFVPSGFLSYRADSGEYVIIDRDKDLGLSYQGNMFKYNEDDGSIEFEGGLNFIQNNKDIRIDAAGNGRGTFEDMNVTINSFLMLDFNIPSSIYEMMALDFLETIDLLGAIEANQQRTLLLYNLAEIVGDKSTKDWEQRSNEEYLPLVEASTKLVKPFVFSEIEMRWDQQQRAFYNTAASAGLSNVLRNDINATFEVYFEVRKAIEGDELDLFVKAGPGSWYYFGFAQDKMLIYSSNEEVNQYVQEKTNQGKAKIGDFVFAPGDRGEVLDFINEFRLIYYGIKEPYQLDAEVEVDEKEKKTSDDDDEGF